MATPHWTGQAIDKIRPKRLVHGAASIREACAGDTMTHVVQMTNCAIKHTIAIPTLKVIANKELGRESLPGAAD
jgi:hypothetical protein